MTVDITEVIKWLAEMKEKYREEKATSQDLLDFLDFKISKYMDELNDKMEVYLNG